MTRRRAINGVLHNFLGTYTSRYSDYDGYWLFGMLVGDAGDLKIDLSSRSMGKTDSAPLAAAVQLAAQKFREQMEKTGLSISCVREAQLDITKLPDSGRGAVNGRVCVGHNVRFVARVVSDYGKKYEHAMSVFVAPHDPAVERRSTRGPQQDGSAKGIPKI
jgi:hypothetical protein